jgi:hypothetical protein
MKISHEKEILYHNINDVPQLTEQVEPVSRNNEIRFDSSNDNIPLYIDSFTARILSSQTDADKI